MEKSKNLLFLKKKKQKDFFMLGLWRWRNRAHAPDSKKFFAPLFFKKAAPFL